MNSNDSIEISAPTIEQAINQALAQLGADQDDVNIEVLHTPRAGVLGWGTRQARVRVTRRTLDGASSGVTTPPPAPPLVRGPTPASSEESPSSSATVKPFEPSAAVQNQEEVPEVKQDREVEAPTINKEPMAHRDRVEPALLAREASTVVTQILELMGEKASIEVVDDSDAENAEINIKGDGSGLLIGRHGQTLDALEYIVNRILARKLRDAAAPVSIDTESYRARRRRQLHRMALAKGEQAKREHVAVALEPMPPRDRRIVHLALKDDPLIITRSTGDGFLRSVEIMPADERREGPGAKGRERRREHGHESGREQERVVPGQQGGFKHGQKKIV